MTTELSRTEVQDALPAMLSILKEADDSRPLAQYIVDLVNMYASKRDAEIAQLKIRIAELETKSARINDVQIRRLRTALSRIVGGYNNGMIEPREGDPVARTGRLLSPQEVASEVLRMNSNTVPDMHGYPHCPKRRGMCKRDNCTYPLNDVDKKQWHCIACGHTWDAE